MKQHWYDFRDPADAPIYLGWEQAMAWASGWNAAVAAYDHELIAALHREGIRQPETGPDQGAG